MYLLKRTDGPGFVAKNGLGVSYTKSLTMAKKYATREDAVADSCVENEVPIDLDAILFQIRSS